MGFIGLFLFGFLLSLSWSIDAQMTQERLPALMALECDEPSVTLHVFSGTPNPVWTISMKQLARIKSVAKNALNNNSASWAKSTIRVMGYEGFTVSCSADNQVFVNGLSPVEHLLLLTGRRHLLSTIIEHVKENVGQVMSHPTEVDPGNVDCNHVPIKGPDTVPVYNPTSDDGGCFVKKQTENNCYAYGTDIVTNTFPQPGRGSGKKWTLNTCKDMGAASVRDGLVYNGTVLPQGQPVNGHYAALLIWPDTNFHWIRKDANGYWSHKPGGTPVRNKDNTGSLITDPSKSDFSPWTQFCSYYIAEPSKLKIN